jgi:hypothetical protein
MEIPFDMPFFPFSSFSFFPYQPAQNRAPTVHRAQYNMPLLKVNGFCRFFNVNFFAYRKGVKNALKIEKTQKF